MVRCLKILSWLFRSVGKPSRPIIGGAAVIGGGVGFVDGASISTAIGFALLGPAGGAVGYLIGSWVGAGSGGLVGAKWGKKFTKTAEI